MGFTPGIQFSEASIPQILYLHFRWYALRTEQFTCSEIKEILMSQVQSLTHLYLDMDKQWDHTFDPGWIGSLADFSNLKHLEIGRKCLTGTPET